jgi:hypothetical protein
MQEPTVEKKVSGVAPAKKVNDSDDSSSDSDSEDEKVRLSCFLAKLYILFLIITFSDA